MDPHSQAPNTIDLVSKSAAIDYLDRQPSTHLTPIKLEIDMLEEVAVSLDNRLVFLRALCRYVYQVLDLLTGSFVKLELDREEMEKFNAFRLYPMEDPSKFTIVGRCSRNKEENYWSYEVAKFQVNPQTKHLEKTKDWKELIRSYIESGSFHFNNDQLLYFIVGTKEKQLSIRVYDIQREKFEDEEFLFMDYEEGQISNWNRYEFKFRTYLNGYIYGFRRFQHHLECTQNIRELIRSFTHVTKRNMKSGVIEKKKLTNDLKCLQIDQSAYSQDATYTVNGSWIDHHFYLQVNVTGALKKTHVSNYFCVLDLDTLTWRSIFISMPLESMQSPIRLLTTSSSDQLVFVRSRMQNGKRKGEEKLLYPCVDVYRLAVRRPETLQLQCIQSFESRFKGNLSVLQKYKQFLVQPVEI